MDLIQENKHLKIDPSGIDITGNGNVVLQSEGHVGIGTKNPDYPLTITTNTQTQMAAWYWNNASGNNAIDDIYYGGDSSVWNISQHTSGYIRSSLGYILDSDKRIKKDIENVPDNFALFQVNNIETKYYNYIDPIRKKEHKTVGFLAQDVRETLPNAVNIIKDFIPDELRMLTDVTWSEVENGWKLTVNDLTLSDNHTGKCKFVLNKPEGKVIIINNVLDDKKSFIFDKKCDELFLIGKEVNDFHSLDKNMIFALHHSAIQELSKKIDTKDTKIEELEKLLQEKDVNIKSLEMRLTSIESVVVTLQNK